jgi:hypothetical protein
VVVAAQDYQTRPARVLPPAEPSRTGGLRAREYCIGILTRPAAVLVPRRATVRCECREDPSVRCVMYVCMYANLGPGLARPLLAVIYARSCTHLPRGMQSKRRQRQWPQMPRRWGQRLGRCKVIAATQCRGAAVLTLTTPVGQSVPVPTATAPHAHRLPHSHTHGCM